VSARRAGAVAAVALVALGACALAACGDNRAVVVDAGFDAVPVARACTAVFSEAFPETVSGPPSCATVEASDGDTLLRFAIPSQTIAAPFMISIDLGAAPGTGTYSSDSLVAPWSADALHEFDMTSCLYHAGTAAVPPGRFTLSLDELDAAGARAHGTLDLVLYVLARPFTYCGETNIERVVVTF
jgi:hypothetical protein